MLNTKKLTSAIKVALFIGTASLVAGNAFAQNQTDEQNEQSRTLDRIEVTGSRIKRAEIEGALPVTVINREQIEASGDVSVADYLRDTTFNSFGSYQSTSGSSGQGATQINMRGLGSARTLILVDGRRVPTTPILGQGQNLNSIPMAAVERIEMLSDGASSIYGSDAIGGVVNIITRKDYDGMEFTVGLGIPSQPGGKTKEMSAVMGTAGERGRILAGASSQSRDVVFTRDRDYWMDRPGTSVYSNNFALAPSTATSQRLQHPIYGTAVPGECSNGTNLFYNTGTGPGSVCQYNHSMISANLTGLKTNSAFMRGDHQINDNWSASFNADVARVRSFGRYAPVPSSPWPGGAIRLDPGTPNHPGTPAADGGLNPHAADPYYAGLANTQLYMFHRFAALGPRDGSTEETTYNFLGAIQGRLWDKVDVDFGMRYADSKAYSLGTNYVVGGLAQAAINRGDYNIYDPFAGDPTALGFTATISRDMRSTMKEAFGSAAFDMFSLPGGTAAAVVGAEYREETYQDRYDPLSESGQIVGSAGNSAGGGRNVWAGYFEMLFPFFTGFEVNLSGRYDKYSDYGSDFSPKLGLRWHPIDSLTVRASYGRGFRAPTLDILSQKTTFSAEFTSDPATCLMLTGAEGCQTQVTTFSIANPNLTSETSKQWSAGVVWDPTSWLNMSLDYYNIYIDNQITSTGLATVVRCLRGLGGMCPAGLSTFAPGTVLPNESLGVGASFDPVTGGITGAQLGYVNLGFVETDGYDFTARTNFDLGWGRLRNLLAISYVNNYSSNGGINNVDLQGVPKMRANLGTSLSLQNVDLNWNASYIHSTENYMGDGRLPSWLIHDVQASFNAPWNGTFTVGVNNVANKDPVYDPVLGGSSYDYYLYNPWGRVTYFRYTQRF